MPVCSQQSETLPAELSCSFCSTIPQKAEPFCPMVHGIVDHVETVSAGEARCPHNHYFSSCSHYRLKGGEAHPCAHLSSCPPTLLATLMGLMCYFRSRNITPLFKMSRFCMTHYIELQFTQSEPQVLCGAPIQSGSHREKDSKSISCRGRIL